MARSRPHDRAGHPLHAATNARALSSSASLPLPFYHHPVVALSLVLMAACLAQLMVWLVSTRLPPGGLGPASGLAVHGHLFTVTETLVHRLTSPHRSEAVLFVVCLGASLLSAGAWYVVARVGIGPAWGLWVALLWVIHPSFAFVASRPGPLALMIPLTAATLACLVCWQRFRRRVAALGAGLALGLLVQTGFQGLLLAPIIFLAMLLSGLKRKAISSGVSLVLLGLGITLTGGMTVVQPHFNPAEALNRLREDWPRSLSDGESVVAQAARRELLDQDPAAAASPAAFLARRLWMTPGETTEWLARRMWRSVYATFNGRLQRPVFAIQMLFLVPAVWGTIIALKYPPWRWTAMLCGMSAGVYWLMAGVVEPLTRNLTPIGGIPVLFGLIGAVDVYERIFGRRLTPVPDENTTTPLR